MQQFSGIITVDGRELIFIFYRIKTDSEDKFIATVEKDNEVYSFDLILNKAGTWRIVAPSPPVWLKKIELQIVDVITRHEFK